MKRMLQSLTEDLLSPVGALRPFTRENGIECTQIGNVSLSKGS